MAAVDNQEDSVKQDLGFGSRVAQQSRQRFLNRDGSFNVARRGHSLFQSLNIYHFLLSLSWVNFSLLVIGSYFFTNILFATGYVLCGPDAILGATGVTLVERFFDSFFFSVETLATIGYGVMSPHGLAANILVTFEALFGLSGFAIVTGLLFSRFSRPTARIIFSEHAIIAPYKGITAFEFRIVNQRSNQLIGVEATVVMARNETKGGVTSRKFHQLRLEREGVMFFPLHWVIVHPIDEKSPLSGVTQDSLEESDAEFLILLTGTDETFSQTVHARSSYKDTEVIWNAKFTDMFDPPGGDKISIDIRRLHEIERLR
jgi:inward rectifier potassium channel